MFVLCKETKGILNVVCVYNMKHFVKLGTSDNRLNWQNAGTNLRMIVAVLK